MYRPDKRAERAAGAGLGLQLVLFALVLVLFVYSHSAATLAASMQFLGGVGIWLLVLVELYQRRLAWRQRQELDEFERERRQRRGGSQSVFEGLSPDEPLPMERRLELVKRWFVPIVAVLNAGVLVLLAVRLMPGWWEMTWLSDALERKPANQQVTLMVLFGVFLVGFVMSRYVVGLSKTTGWRILRAGSNYLMGNTVACLALGIVLALSLYSETGLVAERVLERVIAIVMLFLAAEIVLNLVLDMYRPRVAGEEYRPAYESRVLGLFSEPEGVMRSIAHTIDYQFGFKVSDTWFYQLLQQAVLPLILFGAVVLYLLSCFVMVSPGQRAVVLHFGDIARVEPEGLHLKWPWPIDTHRVYDVERVQNLTIGHSGGGEGHDDEHDEPVLWTKAHVGEGAEEFQLLVATELTGAEVAGKGPAETRQTLRPVNILAGTVDIAYQVDPDQLIDYARRYKSPRTVLEAIAYRQWTQYMASVDPMAVMTTGRGQAAAELHKSIQEQVDQRKLGLKILRVGLLGLHPPVDVAETYEAAINARQERETIIWQAKGEANETVPRARAGGAEVRAEAMADRYGKASIEQAKAKRFEAQLAGYRVAPNVFYLRHYLNVFAEATETVRKYVVALNDPDKVMLILDEKEKLPAGLLDLGEEMVGTLEEQEGK